MQLHHLRAGRGGGGDLGRVGLDEQGDADPGLAERACGVGDAVMAAQHIEAALGGQLLAPLRHQAGGVGPVIQGDGQHLLGDRHFQVQRLAALQAQGGQLIDVGVGDVPAVLAQVRGDPVGAGGDGDLGRAQRLGIAFAAGVPDGRHVVDVHAKADAAHAESLLLPGSSTGRAASSGGKASAG